MKLKLAICFLLCISSVQAQTYRWVDEHGRITFSDQPPPAKYLPKQHDLHGAAEGTSAAGLNYALSRAASNFPVTLYTGSDCVPCNSARNLLINRGVPFTERTITSNEDIDALKQLSGVASLPFGTIGGQQLKGFSDSEWSQYLDAAGYPAQSQLPPSYRRPAPTPLVAAKPAAPATEAAAPAAATPAARPAPAPATGKSPSNPAGIIF